jgi:hypothetical protein
MLQMEPDAIQYTLLGGSEARIVHGANIRTFVRLRKKDDVLPSGTMRGSWEVDALQEQLQREQGLLMLQTVRCPKTRIEGDQRCLR